MAFEYKCVAGPMIVAVKNAKVRDQAVKAFEDIMNTQAAEGWEYVGIDEFHISEPVGILSRKRAFVPSKILVFKRLQRASAVVVALRTQSLQGQSSDLQDTSLIGSKEPDPALGNMPSNVTVVSHDAVSQSAPIPDTRQLKKR